MSDQIKSTRGKLLCYNCHEEIGLFSWTGYLYIYILLNSCSCNENISPAFGVYRRSVIPHVRDNEISQFTETEECLGK